MLFWLFSGPATPLAQVLPPTLLAHFDVCVSLQFCQDSWVDATFAVDAVEVETDDVFEESLVLKLNHGHMGCRRPIEVFCAALGRNSCSCVAEHLLTLHDPFG